MNDLSAELTIQETTKEANDYLVNKACEMIEQENVEVPIEHWIDDGVYYRATYLQPGTVIVSSMMKVPTTIVVVGNCLVTVGDHVEHLLGMKHIKASANRRVAYRSLDGGVFILMYFKVASATTVEEAEKEMTDEYNLLTNHREELLK